MELLRNSKVPIEKWNLLLLKSPYTSPFQTWDFFQLYNSIRGYSAEVFAVEDSGDLKSLCVVTIQKERGIKAYFSNRAIIYGGLIFVDYNIQAIEFLLHHIYIELNHRVIYIEIRNYADYSKMKLLCLNAGWEWVPYMNIKIELKGNSLKDVIDLMNYNRRREIRQSLNEGAIYREANNISEVEDLYLILKELYSKKIKLPVPNIDFFIALYRSSIGKVFVILHNKKIIGGAFCFYTENKSIYTMYYCGKRDYHKKIFPTHLGIIAAIDFGIRSKLKYIDFMGAGLKDKEYGVRKYKQEFGGELKEYGRFRKVNNRFLYVIGESGLKLLKLLS